MKKNLFNTLVLLLIAVAFVSCSKESSEIESSSKGYKVSIPANKISSKAVADGGTATFKTTENVYVCNTDKGNAIDEGVLHPSANTASANFDGTLEGDYEVGNTLKILYNTNGSGVADYSSQNGTLAGVVDAGFASVDVTDISGGTITTGTATINNLQSIFKFTFKNGSTTLNVKSVTISSAGNKIQTQYDVVNETATYSYLTVSNATTLSTVYVALRFTSNENDPITFLVTDENGVQYLGHKNAPSTGFAVSKFYTSTINVTPISFSVDYGTTVIFSPGNLVKTDNTYEVGDINATYEFESIPFNTNGGSLGYDQGAPTSTSARGYFTWNEIATADETPRLFTVNGVSGWRSMTYDECDYLLWYRDMNDGVRNFYRIDLGSDQTQIGFLIPPDGATSDDVVGLNGGTGASSGFTQNVNVNSYISKGFVFLPAVGVYIAGSENKWFRNCTITDVTIHYGYYWLTTEYDDDHGDWLYFHASGQSNDDTDEKYYYCSVRLVRD